MSQEALYQLPQTLYTSVNVPQRPKQYLSDHLAGEIQSDANSYALCSNLVIFYYNPPC